MRRAGIHNVDMWLAFDKAAWRRLIYHRDELGTVRRIGVSTATIDEVLLVLADADTQHIQMAVNLLDWRHRDSSFQAAIDTRPDVTIHARSAFLQGVLLNEEDRWPEWAIAEGWAARILPPLDGLVAELGRRSRADLCLAYTRGIPWVTQVLVGVRTVEQVRHAAMHVRTGTVIISGCCRCVIRRALRACVLSHTAVYTESRLLCFILR